MTYNPDEWEVGDLAWITPNDDLLVTDQNRGRQLRTLVLRRGSRTHPTSGAHLWSAGALHWVNATEGWIMLRPNRHDLILEAERAIAVAPSVLAQQNDRAPSPAFPRQATSWTAASGALIGSNVHITTAPPPARMTARDLRWAQAADINLNCGSPGCPICEARRNRAVG